MFVIKDSRLLTIFQILDTYVKSIPRNFYPYINILCNVFSDENLKVSFCI